MKILRSKTITDAVYEQVKLDIVSGVFIPGQRLFEGDLAKNLDVSRTPVRDAMIRLEQDGLITTKPHRGIFVRKLTRKDIQDYYQTRAVLEGLGAKLATINAKEEDLQKLKDILEEMRNVLELNKDLESFKEIVLINNKFHELIFIIADNDVLAQIRDTLSSPIALVRSTSWLNKDRKMEVWQEHAKIVSAILAKNAELAQKRTEEHIYNAWKSAVSNLKSLKDPEGLENQEDSEG